MAIDSVLIEHKRKRLFITGTRREGFEGDFLSPIVDMFMFSIKNIVFILMICQLTIYLC